MIIIQNSGFVVLKPKSLTFENFRANAKIADGTYASEVVEKIYHRLIENSKDVKADYENYFNDEYDSFSKFIRKRYGIDEDCLKTIIDKLETHDVLFQPQRESRYDNFIEMLFSDDLFPAINRLTEL